MRAEDLPPPPKPPVPYVPHLPEEELALLGGDELVARAVAAHEEIGKTAIWRSVQAGCYLIALRERLSSANFGGTRDTWTGWLDHRCPFSKRTALRYVAIAEFWQEDREGFLARVDELKSMRGVLTAIGHSGYGKKPTPTPAPAPTPRQLPAPKAKPPAKDPPIDAEFSVDTQDEADDEVFDSELDDGTDRPAGVGDEPIDPDEAAEVPEPDERPKKTPSDPRARFAQRIYERAEDLQNIIADASVLRLEHKEDGTFTDKDPKWTEWVNRIQGEFGKIVDDAWGLQDAYPADAPAGSEWDDHPFFREGAR